MGKSLGIIIPADVVRRKRIRDGDTVDVELRARIPTPAELSGTVKFKTDMATLLREMEEGWDDL